MCAATAGARGRSVALFDHSGAIGKKISVSGGGRCNFTNLSVSHKNYNSQNEHFAKSALKRFPPSSIVQLLEKYGVEYYEKKDGQLFCRSSAHILSVLKKECAAAGVKIILGCKINKISKGFVVETSKGTYECDSLVIATGGLSYPKLGATNFGLKLAKKFGLKIVPTFPALTPMLLKPHELRIFSGLAGVSKNTMVDCAGHIFHENILFTHRGLSGPAILNASLYWDKGREITIDLMPDETPITRRLQKVCDEHYKTANIHELKIVPADLDGYDKAEVTRGGVDTDELSSKTFETKKVAGLYFIGEVLDVTGELGGYNLHWAWASGSAAGEFV